MLTRLRGTMRGLLRRGRFEADMDSEMRFHMDRYMEDLVKAGVPPEEAGRRARLEFGSAEAAKDECRRSFGLRWWDDFRRDLRYAARMLLRSPAFSAAAIATLALCIGANTAIFSVVDAALFRPLPYPDPDRLALVALWFHNRGEEFRQIDVTGATVEAVRAHAGFMDTAPFSDWASGVNFVYRNRAEYINQQRVGAGFFRVLGVPPAVGREFTREEDRPGGPPVAVLSQALWKRVFAGNGSVIGSSILLRGEPYTVVGVMPAGFATSTPADVWTPLRASRTGEGGGSNYTIVARIPAGMFWAEAKARLAPIAREITEGRSSSPDATARPDLVPLQEGMTEDLRRPLLVLWGAVALVLLIGCANVAGLLLSRAAARSREIGTRMALGGGRSAVVRQLFTESLLLGICGGVAGVAVGYAGITALARLAGETTKVWQNAHLDARVLVATAVVALLTTVLFGIVPAFETTRVDLRSALSEGGARGVAGGSRRWPRRLLVAGEVAIGMVLLVSAGLMIRTFAGLNALKPGFDGTNVMTAKVSLQDARYTAPEKVNRLFTAGLARMRAIPGVESAAISLSAPYERWLNMPLQRRDGPNAGKPIPITNFNYVTPDFFNLLRIPLLRGRTFSDADGSAANPVAIVNETFARRFLQGQDAVGSHVGRGGGMEIVGVVGNTQQSTGWGGEGPVSASPAVFIPAVQAPEEFLSMVHTWFAPVWYVRTSGPQRNVTGAMQRALESVDPLLPFAGFRSMNDIQYRALARERLQAMLLGSLAALALLMAAVGIYGLIAHSVSERTRELGIRLALGASVRGAISAVAVPGIVLTAAGVGAGWLLARLAVQTLRQMIWGVKPTDTATFAAVAFLLLLTAAAASVIPALRIARLDPARTLRQE